MRGLDEISEEAVRRTAQILGQHSAAAKALIDARGRQESGESVKFFKFGQSLVVVGARPSPPREPQ